MADLTHMVELFSGNFLDMRNPDPASIQVRDIAHGLGMTCRFSGQCSRFYSVAEHALLVAIHVEGQGYGVELQLAALHHDDAEAFVTDVPRPAKGLLPEYMLLEERILAATLTSMNLENLPVHDPVVNDADQWALAQEAGELMTSRGEHWTLGHEWDGTTRGLGISPTAATVAWLYANIRLLEQVRP